MAGVCLTALCGADSAHAYTLAPPQYRSAPQPQYQNEQERLAAEQAAKKKAAEEDKELISDSIKDGSLIIVVAGLGGGTGSGVSPVISKIAKELHIPTIAFVTSPLDFEGKIRCKTAEDSIIQLQNVVDVLSVISIEKILESSSEYKKIPIPEFYLEVDEILRLSITNVIKYINSQVIKEKSMKDILKTLKNDNLCNIIYEKNNLNPIIEYFSNN